MAYLQNCEGKQSWLDSYDKNLPKFELEARIFVLTDLLSEMS